MIPKQFNQNYMAFKNRIEAIKKANEEFYEKHLMSPEVKEYKKKNKL